MKRMRILTVFLVLVLLAGLLPLQAAADRNPAPPVGHTHQGVILDENPSGGYVGDYVIIYNPSTDVNTGLSTGSLAGKIELTAATKRYVPPTANPSALPNPELPAALPDPMEEACDVVEDEGPVTFPEPRRGVAYNVGALKTFHIIKRYSPTDADAQLQFKVLYVGAHCRIWTVVNANYGPLDRIDSSLAKAHADAFDSKFDLMRSYYGDFRDTNADGKVNILFYNISDGVNGYFRSMDLDASDNGLPMLHIDTVNLIQQTDGTVTMDSSKITMEHEFQHLINYSVSGGMITWLNEALSTSAEELCYPGQRLLNRLLGWTNYSINSAHYYGGEYPGTDPEKPIHTGASIAGTWDSDAPKITYRYGLGMLFLQYLYTHYGDGVYKKLIQNNNSAYTNDGAFYALTKSTGVSMESLMRRFFISLAANDLDAGYGFRYHPGSEEVIPAYNFLGPVLYLSEDPADVYGCGFITVKPRFGQPFYPPADAASGLKYVGVTLPDRGYTAPYDYDETDYYYLIRFLEHTDESGVKNGAKVDSRYNPKDPRTWGENYYDSSQGRYVRRGPIWSKEEEINHAVGLLLKDESTGQGFGVTGTLNLQSMEHLAWISADGTGLSNIFLYNLPALNSLYASGIPQLTGLDLRKLPALERVYCNDCALAGKSFVECPEITSLDLSGNQFGTLSLPYQEKLEYLNVSDNPMVALFLAENCHSLWTLNCSGTQLYSLNLSSQPELYNLYCADCPLTELDLSGFPSLSTLDCANNQLTALNLSANSNLYELDCSGNRLTGLDLSPCPGLDTLICYDNQLTALDLSPCGNLHKLDCKRNPTGSLNVAPCPWLEHLDCDAMGLTQLDLSGNGELTYLSCYNNSLTGLDLSRMPYLVSLYCSKNQLTELDFSRCYSLLNVSCKNNPICSLDFSNSDYILVDRVQTDSEQNGYVGIVQKVPEGDGLPVLTLHAVPKQGCEFICWYGDDDSTVSTDRSFDAMDAIDRIDVFTARFDRMVDTPYTYAKCDPATGKPVISWDGVPQDATYQVYWATSKTGTYSLLKSTTGYRVTHTAAEAGKAYYYKVRAKADGYTSPFSEIRSLTCDLPRPVVTGGHNPDTGKNKLTWTAVEGAKEYEIYRSDSKTGTYSRMKTTTELSYTNTGAKAGETWYYKVRAIHEKSAANSADSEVKTLTCDLPRPVVKGGHNPDTGKNQLTWEAVEGAREYEIYRSDSKTGTFSKMKTTTELSYTNTGAKAGETWYYKVRAIHEKSAANSTDSELKTLTCDLARPVVTVSLSSGKPKLSWKAVEGAREYEIYRSDSKTGAYSKMKTTANLTYTNTTAVSGKTYWYKVKALHANSAADSVCSLPVSQKAG